MTRAPFETPPAAIVLSILGMIFYPVCVVGLAWTVGRGYSPIAGWVVAVAGTVGAMTPMWLRDLSGQQTARDQQAWANKADPAGRVEIRAMQTSYTPPTQALPGLPVAGPAVAKPYDD